MNMVRTGFVLILCLCFVQDIESGLLDFLKLPVHINIGWLDDKAKVAVTPKPTPTPKPMPRTTPKPNILNSMQGLVSSVATGDRIQTLLVLLNVELASKNVNPVLRFLLTVAKKLLDTLHPVYLWLFPGKVDRGSLTDNLAAGAGGFANMMKSVGALTVNFLANYGT